MGFVLIRQKGVNNITEMLAEFGNGPQGIHVDNLDGFPVNFNYSVFSEFAQGTDYILGGHPHILGHLFSGER